VIKYSYDVARRNKQQGGMQNEKDNRIWEQALTGLPTFERVSFKQWNQL